MSQALLLSEASSSDRRATATNRMLSNDLEDVGRSVVIFGIILKSSFLTHFGRLSGLSLFAYFNAISKGFNGVNCFICIYFV